MIETDLLIIGSGFAGLWAAIAAKDNGVENVTLVDKGAIGMSGQSRMAAGATIYCLPKHDNDLWLRDFVEAQRYLSRQDFVEDIINTSYSRLMKLESWGVQYRRTTVRKKYFTFPSRGFKHIQMLVFPKWKQKIGGSAVVGALLAQVKNRKMGFHSKTLITGLLKRDGRVAGAVGVNRVTGAPVVFKAGAVILAGADCSFRGQYAGVAQTTGDAFKLAYDAGVRLSNMEFLAVNTGPPEYGFEGTGVAARFGGGFLNKEKQRFMRGYHPDGDLAEICYVVQAMADQVVKGKGPPFYLDMSKWPGSLIIRKSLEGLGGFMPLNLKKLKDAGVPLFKKPQPWAPAIQSLRGGVRTDLDCMSDLHGLFAAGMSQALDPGLFNGWSSMRAMWSGEKAGEAAANFLKQASDVEPEFGQVQLEMARATAPATRRLGGRTPDEVCERLQRVLFPYTVCIKKSEDSLKMALCEVENIRDEELPALYTENPHETIKAHETASMVLSAELFLRASIERRETRGDHCRSDYPDRNDNQWLKWINQKKGDNKKPIIETEPTPLASYKYKPRHWEEGGD